MRRWCFAACLTLVMLCPASVLQALGSTGPAAATAHAAQATDADLTIDPNFGIYVQRNGANVSSAVFGYLERVFVKVENLGMTDANLTHMRLGIRSNAPPRTYNYSFMDTYPINISATSPGNFALIEYNWRVNLTVAGAYEMWAWADSQNAISEANESNNFVTIEFTIAPLQFDAVIITDKTEYEPGEVMIVTATFTYSGTMNPVPSLPNVYFELLSESTLLPAEGTSTPGTTTSQSGEIAVILVIPADLTPGRYVIVAHALDRNIVSNTAVIVTEPASNGIFSPMTVLILAAVAVVAVVAAALILRRSGGRDKAI